MQTANSIALLFSTFTLIAISTAHAADPTTELLAKLASPNPNAEFAATVRIKETSTQGDDDGEETTQSEITVTVRTDSTGFQVLIPAETIKRAQMEAAANAADIENPEPTANLLSSFDLLRLKQLINFSPVLQNILVNAELISQADEAFAGKPARKLSFTLPPRMSEEDRDDIDDYESTLTIWLNPDSGIPVAIAKSSRIAGSTFFIDFAMYEKNTYLLDLIDGRLVVTSVRKESGGSGLGQYGKTVTEIKLTPM